MITASQQIDRVSNSLTHLAQSRAIPAREIKPLVMRLDRIANTLEQRKEITAAHFLEKLNEVEETYPQAVPLMRDLGEHLSDVGSMRDNRAQMLMSQIGKITGLTKSEIVSLARMEMGAEMRGKGAMDLFENKEVDDYYNRYEKESQSPHITNSRQSTKKKLTRP